MLLFLYIALAFTFMYLGYLIPGGNLVLLFQPAELIIIGFPSLFFGVAATSWRAFGASWRLAFGRPAAPDPHLVKQVCRYLRIFGHSSIWMGLIAFFMGLAITMGALNEPPEVVGHHIGACFVALIYASLFHLLAYVAEHRIRGWYPVPTPA